MKKDLSLDDPKVSELLNKLSGSRDELSRYMAELEEIRKKAEELFPSNHDFRNRYILEEKIKTVSSLYSTVLNIRQEFNKTIKDEIEIRRKLSIGEDEDVLSDSDIRKLALIVEESQKDDNSEDKLQPTETPSISIAS